VKETETAKFLAVIKTAYPNFEVNPAVIKLWHEFIQHISFEKAQRNLYEHIASNKFPPTIADIYRYDPEKELEKKRIMSINRDIASQEWIRAGKNPEDFDWSKDYYKNEEDKPLKLPIPGG
jgi:hypothetical protein